MSTSVLSELSAAIGVGRELSTLEIEQAAAVLAEPLESESAKAEFLSALARRGETAEEVAAFARYFLERAVNPGVEQWAAKAVDIVGTGGDHSGGFNISSMVVLVLASAGLKVMKHGNRGITSKCGSADLLAALGYDLQASPDRVRGALDELGYAFFFAPAYHPAFKHIAPVRKQLAAQGQRTVFNVLGPLINPGRPACLLLGCHSLPWVDKLAAALHLLGRGNGLVSHGVIDGERGIDEITTATVNRVRGFGRFRAIDGDWQAFEFGLAAAPFAELQGGDVETNRAIAEALMTGRGPKGLVDTIAFNAAIAMWVAGHTAAIADGIAFSRELLVGGDVARKVAQTREFFR
jgi:anthranilate phosphoribosyltransferase